LLNAKGLRCFLLVTKVLDEFLDWGFHRHA
jgi:hypothetical protein